MRYEIKELGVGGILDQAITLIKNHFVMLFLISFVLSGPLLIISNLSNPTGSLIENLQRSGQPVEPPSPLAAVVYVVAVAFYFLIAYPVTNAAVIHAVAAEYLEQPTSVGKAFARGFRVIIPLIWTALLVSLATYIFSCLVVPWILGMIYFTFALQVVVIEGSNGSEAMRRSVNLVKGNVATVVVLGIVMWAISFGITMISQLIPERHVGAVAAGVVQSLVILFGNAAWVVFYFSCRCKLENFDLSILADAVGQDDVDVDPAFPAT